MSLQTIALVLTAAWHSLAAWHFLLFPERTLRRTTDERPPNPIACELFRFLGALNAALAGFALLAARLPSSGVWIALAGFSLVNLSQFAVDLRVLRRGLVRGAMFRTILAGDGLVFALDGALALWLLK